MFRPRPAASPWEPPRGIKLKGDVRVILPSDTMDFDTGLAALRREIGRIRAGERFTHPSPLFGKLTHDQWVGLHCNHAAMHLGFLTYPGAPDATNA